MVRHFFIDKCNTILKESEANTGLNPIAELNYGKVVTRILLHFDERQILSLVEDRTFANLDKLNCCLHMTNAAAIDGVPYDKDLKSLYCSTKERATSFTILALALNKDFDGGRGYNFTKEVFLEGNEAFTVNGSNWYQATNETEWDEEGVYSNEVIAEEYQKFLDGVSSIVIGSQHFDFGDEMLNIDITDYIKGVINGDRENHGIMLCFAPVLEDKEPETTQYVGFFTDHTNTFFHPYLEAEYNEVINDDRESFYIGKENRLYLYSYIDGKLENLDELPTCSIGTVYQATKGVYYSVVSAEESDELSPEMIYEDVWSNIIYNGTQQPDVVMEFVALPKQLYFQIGNGNISVPRLVPTIYGINDDEKIGIGEVREIIVDMRKKFTTNKRDTITTAYYRLYVKDANREIDIFNGYQPVEKSFLNNYFTINTSDLIPNKYYVDIKVVQGKETLFYKDSLHFTVVSNVTKRYV